MDGGLHEGLFGILSVMHAISVRFEAVNEGVGQLKLVFYE